MTLLHTAIAFLIALAILVVIHELGHYWVARWCGVKVLRFSVGMGKVIYSRRLGPDQTEWAVSMLPLGGYVKMLDAREQDVSKLAPEDLRREFTRQSVWKRIAIVAAGPIANFLLAIFVLAGLFMHGMPEPTTHLRAVPVGSAAYDAGLRGGETITAVNGEEVRTWSELRWKLVRPVIDKTPVRLAIERKGGTERRGQDMTPATVDLQLDSISAEDLEGSFLEKLGLQLARPKPVLGRVLQGGAAMRSGLREGDEIVSADGAPVADGLAFVELVRASAGKPLKLVVLRDGSRFTSTVTPEAVSIDGQLIGRIKAEVPLAPEMITLPESPLSALGKAAGKTWDTSILSLKMLGKMVFGDVSWKNLTGPITIADYAGQTARIGIISYLSFIAFVSISLGIMNLLPIPVLDGGLLLYYSVELLTGRALPERIGELGQRAGVGILMTLAMVAVFNDIVRLMS